MAKLIIRNAAKRDLESIISYIENELNSSTAAKTLLDTFFEKTDRLRDFPEMYPEYRAVGEGKFKYRFFPLKNYIVIYYVFADDVYIRRIIYSKRNIIKL